MCSDRAVLEEAIAKRRNPKEWRITETANECEKRRLEMEAEK
jgi:tRNA A-37 threonylcarbamoyl transferase component Bud32